MPKYERLTERQVIQLHQLLRDGLGRKAIARILGCSAGTVSAHGSLQIAYSSAVVDKCSLKRPLKRGRWLTLDEAAPWLPGHPSHRRLWKLAGSGALRARLVEDRSARRGRVKYVTRLPWMRSYALSVLPRGIWVPVADISNYAPGVAVEASRRMFSRGDEGVVELPRLLAACEESGVSPAFGPVLIRRAVLVVREMGCCLL